MSEVSPDAFADRVLEEELPAIHSDIRSYARLRVRLEEGNLTRETRERLEEELEKTENRYERFNLAERADEHFNGRPRRGETTQISGSNGRPTRSEHPQSQDENPTEDDKVDYEINQAMTSLVRDIASQEGPIEKSTLKRRFVEIYTSSDTDMDEETLKEKASNAVTNAVGTDKIEGIHPKKEVLGNKEQVYKAA